MFLVNVLEYGCHWWIYGPAFGTALQSCLVLVRPTVKIICAQRQRAPPSFTPPAEAKGLGARVARLTHRETGELLLLYEVCMVDFGLALPVRRHKEFFRSLCRSTNYLLAPRLQQYCFDCETSPEKGVLLSVKVFFASGRARD